MDQGDVIVQKCGYLGVVVTYSIEEVRGRIYGRSVAKIIDPKIRTHGGQTIGKLGLKCSRVCFSNAELVLEIADQLFFLFQFSF